MLTSLKIFALFACIALIALVGCALFNQEPSSAVVSGPSELRSRLAVKGPYALDQWMGLGMASLGSKKLTEILMPGSHDTESYNCTDYLGIVQAQDGDVTAQLIGGARFFDLRFERTSESSPSIHTVPVGHHGIIECDDNIRTLGEQMDAFYNGHPERSKEIVLLQLDFDDTYSSTYFDNDLALQARILPVAALDMPLATILSTYPGKNLLHVLGTRIWNPSSHTHPELTGPALAGYLTEIYSLQTPPADAVTVLQWINTGTGSAASTPGFTLRSNATRVLNPFLLNDKLRSPAPPLGRTSHNVILIDDLTHSPALVQFIVTTSINGPDATQACTPPVAHCAGCTASSPGHCTLCNAGFDLVSATGTCELTKNPAFWTSVLGNDPLCYCQSDCSFREQGSCPAPGKRFRIGGSDEDCNNCMIGCGIDGDKISQLSGLPAEVQAAAVAGEFNGMWRGGIAANTMGGSGHANVGSTNTGIIDAERAEALDGGLTYQSVDTTNYYNVVHEKLNMSCKTAQWDIQGVSPNTKDHWNWMEGSPPPSAGDDCDFC